MIYPEELVNLFKKHGVWKTNLFVFIMMCVSIVGAIVFSNGICLVNAMWCGINIFGDYVMCGYKEELELAKATLADTQDDLCISRHEVERLTLELETTQAALLEAKKPKNTTQQKAEAIAEEVSAEGYIAVGKGKAVTYTQKKGSEVSETPTNVPKRKPAPRGTRKPKTKNENKD